MIGIYGLETHERLMISYAIVIVLGVRFVLDTSIMVAAVRSDEGASRRLLESALARRFVLLMSVTLMLEYEDVLTRTEHLAASGLRRDEVETLLDAVATVTRPVSVDFLWRPAGRDPDDDMVLECAINGRADAIVTFNVRDFRSVSSAFGIHVWTPGEALSHLPRRPS